MMKVKLSQLQENTWNPNRMAAADYQKLKLGIKRLLAQAKGIPPIVVRPDLEEQGSFEIIDGKHRKDALLELGETEADVVVLNVDDREAKLLTINLNYLRGEPSLPEYADLIAELERDTSLKELALVLPETETELRSLLDSYKEPLDDLHREAEQVALAIDQRNQFLHFRVTEKQREQVEEKLTDSMRQHQWEDDRRGRTKALLTLLEVPLGSDEPEDIGGDQWQP